MQYAAIDCGTNSLRLLISEVDPVTGKMEDVVREMKIIRLGEGVDDAKRINAAALERLRAGLVEYQEIISQHSVQAVRMVATSAMRDAANKEDFFVLTKEVLGQPAEIIAGEEEAQLSFLGAVAGLGLTGGPYAVIDLGGGSTEFIVGTKEGSSAHILGAISTNMGCVRITERHLHQQPPTAAEIAAGRKLVQEQLAQVAKAVPLTQAKTIIGCAGTFNTLAAIANGLESYDPELIHGSVVSFDKLRATIAAQLAMTPKQRLENPIMHPGRADVIGGGCLVVEQIMAAVAPAGITEFLIAETDILDGVIMSLV